MNIERSVLIAFLGNYLIGTVATALVALIPATQGGGILSPQYIVFVIIAAIVVALLTHWYLRAANKSCKSGALFGVVGVVLAVVTAFVTGISGVLSQTGSLTAVMNVLPNFWPFIANTQTLVLVGYWIVPATFIGWWLGRPTAPTPMM